MTYLGIQDRIVPWQGKMKRRSAVTKNEHFRAMLQNCVRNRIPCRYGAMTSGLLRLRTYVKLKLDKEFIMALKTNRKVALCQQDKLHGRYHRLNQLDLPGPSSIWNRCSVRPGRWLDRCALSGDVIPP